MADEIFLIQVARQGPTGGNVSTNDWSLIRAEVDSLLASRTTGLTLGALANVLSGVDASINNYVLTYGSGSSRWYAAPAPVGISKIYDTSVLVVGDAIGLDFSSSFTVLSGAQDGGPKGTVYLALGGSGSANSPARSDHSHSPTTLPIFDFAATGNLSSGSRTLASGNTGILVSGVTYDIEARGRFSVKNSVNSGTVNLTVSINGSTRSIACLNVGGVPSWYEIEHGAIGIVGTGASLPVILSTSFVSGDPSDIRGGQLTIKAHPRR